VQITGLNFLLTFNFPTNNNNNNNNKNNNNNLEKNNKRRRRRTVSSTSGSSVSTSSTSTSTSSQFNHSRSQEKEEGDLTTSDNSLRGLENEIGEASHLKNLFLSIEDAEEERVCFSNCELLNPRTSASTKTEVGRTGSSPGKGREEKWSYVDEIESDSPPLAINPDRYICHFDESSLEDSEYIRELSFSPCGGFICSPYNNGVRIFALPSSITSRPVALGNEIQDKKMISPRNQRPAREQGERVLMPMVFSGYPLVRSHVGEALTVKFEPRGGFQLASGGTDGTVRYYSPAM